MLSQPSSSLLAEHCEQTEPPSVEYGKAGSQDPAQPSWPKKRAPTPEPATYRKRMRGAVKDLVLGEASKSEKSLHDTFVVRHESPWETFSKVYACELAGPFNVALRRVRPSRLVAIRTFQGLDGERALQRFKELHHPNILSSRECFLHDGSVFILHDELSISLDHLVACEAYPNEIEVAAALAQILDGLIYLTNQWVEHPCLSSPNILVARAGEVKIAGLEECLQLPAGSVPQYSKPLGVMQKYEKEDGKIGVDDIERWGCDSNAIGFLSSIGSRSSLGTLRKRYLGEKAISWVWCLLLCAHRLHTAPI
ncbi:conserved hypothetical protein [Histoplasma capsulatum H143]|uniref:Protein kinase domain-containing protein n=1 Tax=Ajellomyces capsulatus (strain H143) TaxID=544712 RepID=C6HA63_AJECH|nr:conserved hypothetical protein [Histoplasma capsulatum H143]